MNVKSNWLHVAVDGLKFKVGKIHLKYLGLPIGVNPRLLSTWKHVVDTIRKRLSSWANKNLSIGGKVVLIKSILSALPVYFLSLFKAFPGIISRIEFIFKQYTTLEFNREKLK